MMTVIISIIHIYKPPLDEPFPRHLPHSSTSHHNRRNTHNPASPSPVFGLVIALYPSI